MKQKRNQKWMSLLFAGSLALSLFSPVQAFAEEGTPMLISENGGASTVNETYSFPAGVSALDNGGYAFTDATLGTGDFAIEAATDGAVFRMYNRASGEHFYTRSAAERDSLIRSGWDYESDSGFSTKGYGKGTEPVYRMYNPNTGLHHYTGAYGEAVSLKQAGWNFEGVSFYTFPADSGKGAALYREYNPNDGNHNYTTNAEEHKNLIAAGWQDESIGFCVKADGEVYVLVTSDVHCGVDQNFGYSGLQEIRDELEYQGFATLLVDDGDSIQGESLGTMTKGEAIIDLMNAMKYDVCIPGNHEFDYGMDQFLALVKKAEYPYISCNLTHEGKNMFSPYIVLEAGGHKIGFVGMTTPKTLTTSTPAYFQNEQGEFVYDFSNDTTGEKVYKAVQDAVDGARKEGAEIIYAMGHMGNEDECKPWTYADIISHTTGIDVFLDGHSHDTDQIVMKNQNGESVNRSAVGTKLKNIGYSHINAAGKVDKTDIWTFSKEDAPVKEFTGKTEIASMIDAKKAELADILDQVVAKSEVELTIYDPVEKDSSGNPLRIVRSQESNLGDFCADAYRQQAGTDIAMVNGGGVRGVIHAGDVTYNDILGVNPNGNELCVLEVTGQTILDALEWGVKDVPSQSGGFPQVSGLSYTIDTRVDSCCTKDENGVFTGFNGDARRVSDVKVGDEALDPEKTYTLAGHSYMFLKGGDGYSMLKDAKVLSQGVKLDVQVLIDYITEALGGVIGEEYADPYGQGRITILE